MSRFLRPSPAVFAYLLLALTLSLFAAPGASGQSVAWTYPNDIRVGVPCPVTVTWTGGLVDVMRIFRGTELIAEDGSGSGVISTTFTFTAAGEVQLKAEVQSPELPYPFYETITLTVAANNGAPVASVSIDGFTGNGAITRPYGGASSITVHFKATDPNSNLSKIAPMVWHGLDPAPIAYPALNEPGWLPASGGSAEVVRTISLDRDGPWYFWCAAVDTASSFGCSPPLTAAQRIVVSEGPPPDPTSNLPPAELTVNPQKLVATLPGDFSVDNRGSANYSIPLKAPSGRAGMEPKLSLGYSSNGGNGPLGLGWALSTGFPQSITRGRSILARDGVTRGVTYTADDKFYLDGKRLICVSTDKTYGQPGSKYRTEVDSFVTILAGGTSVIDSFTVTDKAGTTMVFGKSAGSSDAFHTGMGESEGKAYAWLLKRVVDPVGNNCVFTYVSPVAGERVLSAIDYTGNSTTSPVIDPTQRVEFSYNTRTVSGATERRDSSFSYIGGRRLPATQRLDSISVKSGTAEVGRYVLRYEYAPNGGSTRLLGVTPYLRDPDGTAFNACNETTFQWNESTVACSSTLTSVELGFHALGQTTPTWVEGTQAFGDFNGDGMEDSVSVLSSTPASLNTSQIRVQLSTGAGLASPAVWANLNMPAPQFIRVGDINGDGRKDLIFGYLDPTRTLYAFVSNGSGFVGLNGLTAPTFIRSLDSEFDDGWDDDPAHPQPQSWIYLGHEQGGAAKRLVVADFTGDGRDDILVHCFSGKLSVAKSVGNGFEAPVLSARASGAVSGSAAFDWGFVFLGFRYSGSNISPMPCDVNGDGITDYAWSDTRQDWYGDDYVQYSASGMAYVSVMVSQPGGGFSAPYCIDSWMWPDGYGMYMPHRGNVFVVMPGDVNGDGMTDFMCIRPRWNEVYGNSACELELSVAISTAAAFTSSSAPWFHMKVGAIPSTVTLNGQSVNPWFDKVRRTDYDQWYFGNPFGQCNWDDRGALTASAVIINGENMSLIDLNNDGRADYVWYCEEQNGWVAMFSLGDSFAGPQLLSGLTWTPSPQFQKTGSEVFSRSGIDLNGDGVTDWAVSSAVTWKDKSKVVGIQLGTGSNGNRIVAVTDALGRKTEVAYKPITDNSVYTPGAAVTYPIRELRNATYVVSELWKDTGSTDTADRAHFSYQYSGNRLDLSGRGALGFHSFVTLDRQTNVFKYQFLTQSFPMTGLTAREEIYRQTATNTFNIISSHDNTVVFDKVVKTPDDPTTWGTLYPFISRSIEYRWEDGAKSFTVAATGTSTRPEELFGVKDRTDAHITIRAESWFDQQTGVLAALPAVAGQLPYKPSDTDASGSSNVNAVGGTKGKSEQDNVIAALPGAITYGNLKKLVTDFGDSFTETVSTDYFTPAETGGLTGLVKNVTTVVEAPAPYTSETAPIKRYTYWPTDAPTKTPLVATEEVDAADDQLDLTTTFNRDSTRPWLITSTTITGYDNPGTEGTAVLGTLDANDDKARHIGSFTASSVSVFDPKWDAPTSSANAYSHTTTTEYHSILGVPTSVKDANGAGTTTTYDALGRKLTVTDIFNTAMVTTSTYSWDSTQSVTPPTDPDDSSKNFNGVRSSDSDKITGVSAIVATSVYAVQTTATVQPAVTAYFDRLGRTIRTIKQGFGTQQTVTDTVYNTLGQTIAVSLPYASGSTPLWTLTTYDPLGRVATVRAPNGTVTTNTYQGRCTTVSVDAPNLGGVDPAAQSNTTYVDAKGRTIKVWNADISPGTIDLKTGGSTTPSLEYKLDGFGRMRETILQGDDTAGHRIEATYDALGRQESLADPDKGTWSYCNNALGQVVKQTDAKSTVTRSTFDRLGRPLSRKTAELGTGTLANPNGPVENASWYYYDFYTDATLHLVGHSVGSTDQGWIGAPQREMAKTDNAPGYGDPGTASIHYYDTLGRPTISLNQVDGKYFYTCAGYDAYSRAASMRYFWRPAGQEDAAPATSTTPYYWNDWGYTYTYDGTGASSKSYLIKIQDSASTPRTWWEAYPGTGYDHLDRPVTVRKGNRLWTNRTYRDADGLLTGITTGAGSPGMCDVQNLAFDYDGLGNLTQRTKYEGGRQQETLTYDTLNRLQNSTIGGGITYATNGNIITKTGVDGSPSGTYTYDPVKPHAVKTAFGNTMTYDANGNLLTRTSADKSWSTSWAGFDKPRSLGCLDLALSIFKSDEFTYNANRSRVMHLSYSYGTGPARYTRKKIYGLGPSLEVDYSNVKMVPGAPDWKLDKIRIYVPGPEGIIGTMEFNPRQSFDKAEAALVYHYDHLGSIERITPYGSTSISYVLDGAGKPSRYSYDAWGQRRNADTWTGKPATTADGGSDDATPRGFTGHEMLDDIGLVHMNGRIYDALLGRFLSADLVVQAPANLQSFNRYSYCGNNPLSFTDPSGFETEAEKKQREEAEKKQRDQQRLEQLAIAYSKLSTSEKKEFVAGFQRWQKLQEARKGDNEKILDKESIKTSEKTGGNQKVDTAPPVRTLEGSAPSSGPGGPGGTRQPGTESRDRNCAGVSLGLDSGVDWPHTGENPNIDEAAAFVPKGFKELPNDGATTTTTRAKTGEREVVLFLWTGYGINGKTGHAEIFIGFHMVGRSVDKAGAWESKQDVGPVITGITNPDQSLRDAYPSVYNPGVVFIKRTFTVDTTKVETSSGTLQ